MGNEMIRGLLFIGTLVGLLLGLGFAARFGAFKRTFITKGIPGIYPKNLVYALIPLGFFFLYIGFIAFTIGENWPENGLLFTGAVAFLGLVIFSLFWQPRLLKPAWLRWLEDYYGHVLEGMFEEARQMGPRNWEVQVKTQAELENWADGVAKKYGWQRQR